MIANCPGCAADGLAVKERSRARARLPWLGFLPAMLYAVAPKCPLCVVAYLSAFGVTFGMASLALCVLRALAVASVALVLGLAIRRSTAKLRKSAGPSPHAQSTCATASR